MRQDPVSEAGRRRGSAVGPGCRIGVLGGSFDPVHNGHIRMAEAAMKTAELDYILFVPARESPLKAGCMRATGRQRLDMLRLALEGTERAFGISTVDMDRPGASYTVETMMILEKAHPGNQWFFIMGADSLLTFYHWHNVRTLIRLCDFIILARPGFDFPGGSLPGFDADQSRKLTKYIVGDFNADISSTEIRARIKSGAPLEGLLPDRVSGYITENRLYGAGHSAG